MLSAADDLLHEPTPERLFTETNWFGFVNVPGERIAFGIYVGFKPNLNLSYSWIAAFRGRHLHHASMDYFDRRQYMAVPDVTAEGYRLDNGLEVSIVEPLKTFRLRYLDDPRKFGVDVVWDAICPPVAWQHTGHFDHFGRVTGELTLGGVPYRVDTIAQRDHSWSVRNDEVLPAVPPKPFAWVWGAFGDDWAFQTAANWALTGASEAPTDASATPVRAGGGERASWVWDGSRLEYADDVALEIEWSGLLDPKRVRISFRTEGKVVHSFDGEVLGTALIPNTFNASTLVCQIEWSDGARRGLGDVHLSVTPANYHLAGA